ncbi:uncharacterized [Tachysurus ichikawai]
MFRRRVAASRLRQRNLILSVHLNRFVFSSPRCPPLAFLCRRCHRERRSTPTDAHSLPHGLMGGGACSASDRPEGWARKVTNNTNTLAFLLLSSSESAFISPTLFFEASFPLYFIGPMLPYARWRTQSVKILTGGASLALSAVCSSNKDPYALCSARRVTPLLLLRPLPSILSILLPPPTLRSITTEPWMNCEYYYVLHFTTCRSINAEHVI